MISQGEQTTVWSRIPLSTKYHLALAAGALFLIGVFTLVWMSSADVPWGFVLVVYVFWATISIQRLDTRLYRKTIPFLTSLWKGTLFASVMFIWTGVFAGLWDLLRY